MAKNFKVGDEVIVRIGPRRGERATIIELFKEGVWRIARVLHSDGAERLRDRRDLRSAS
jgi:ribosomal protein L24